MVNGKQNAKGAVANAQYRADENCGASPKVTSMVARNFKKVTSLISVQKHTDLVQIKLQLLILVLNSQLFLFKLHFASFK